MNNPLPIEPWEEWFRRFRGTELAKLVLRLAEVALAQGSFTVDDARSVPLLDTTDPRIRGGAIRVLQRLEIADRMEEERSSASICHHRRILRFKLANASAARSLLQASAAATLELKPAEMPYQFERSGQAMMNL